MAGRKRSSDEFSIGDAGPGEVQSGMPQVRRCISRKQQVSNGITNEAHEALTLQNWEEDLLALDIGEWNVSDASNKYMLALQSIDRIFMWLH
jgi:hypothetical protein